MGGLLNVSPTLLDAPAEPFQKKSLDRYGWPHENIDDAIRWWRHLRWQNSLADLIEHFCETHEVTGVELARRLGHKNSSFVSRIRNGRVSVTRRTLDVVSVALDLSAAETRLLYAVAGDLSVVPIPPQRLGALVASMRETAGMTQEELGALLNIDGSTVSRLEEGRRHPQTLELAMLSEILPRARDNPLLYFAAGRLPPEAVLREDEVAVAAFAEYVRWLHVEKESYREALELIEPNLELIRHLSLSPVIKAHYWTELSNSYAECLLMTGHMDQAIRVAIGASRSAKDGSDPVQVADAQSRLAGILYTLDRDRDAVHAAQDGLDSIAALTRDRRGGLSWWRGQLEVRRIVSQAYVANTAEKLDARLLSRLDPWLEQRIDNKDYAAHAWGTKAELLPLIGDIDGALAAWTKEQEAAERLGTPGARLDALLNGAEIALKANEQSQAERLLSEARLLADQSGLGWSTQHIARLEQKMASA